MPKKYDFAGWASVNDVLCTDGTTIRQNAFAHDDGKTVPLMWMHGHHNPENVIGQALLENRPEGVFAYGSFNGTPTAEAAKQAVMHGDVDRLSIFANHLTKDDHKNITHGQIKEVSLVLAGADPEAKIVDTMIVHGDTVELDEAEAVIFHGEGHHITTVPGEIDVDIVAHSDKGDDSGKEGDEKVGDDKGKTVEEIFNTMTDEQRQAALTVIAAALEESESGEGVKHSDMEGEDMGYNAFDQGNDSEGSFVITHDDMKTLVSNAKRLGSMRESFEQFLDDNSIAHDDITYNKDADGNPYGIGNYDMLFPDYQNVTAQPQWIKRRTEWVSAVMSGVHHTPFSRIKSMFADITEDAARAKGYIKGKRKKEEVFSLLKRTTDPTTVYKKQKMDRDDVLDMAGFDVIVWIKGEMRLMLDEEIARAIVYGDGRLPSDEDKIDETHIRPIVKDDSLFVIKKDMAGADPVNAAKTFDDDHVRAMKEYEGSGNPVMLIQQSLYTELILRKDAHGYRLYKTDAELATALQVDRLIKIPDVIAGDVYSVTINFTDYNVGADKGADIGMFEDFDIDFNQMKYLIETRISGALTKPYSAVVIKRGTAQQSGGNSGSNAQG